MIRCTRSIAVGMLLCTLTLPAWADSYYLYTPQPVPPGSDAASPDGVLVKEIEVRRGDTLYGLSRKFSGHGSYYPQILLFNSIHDPNLIYAGTTIKVPAPHANETTAAAPATLKKKTATSQKRDLKRRKRKSAAVAGATGASHPVASAAALKRSRKPANPATKADLSATTTHKHSTVVRPEATQREASAAAKTPSSKDQQLYEKAVTAYRHDDYRAALELFDRYLATNPASPLAADASLYKADCYLKLAAQ